MSDYSQKNIMFVLSVCGALGTLIIFGRLAGSVETKLDNVIKVVEHKDAVDAAQTHAISVLERDTAVLNSKLHGLQTAVGKVPGKVIDRLSQQDE